MCLPERRVTNVEIAEKLDIDPAWVEQKLGIRERRLAGEGQLTSDLAVSAARIALTSAGLGHDAIDLVILATATPDRQAPSTACIVQSKLGMAQVPAFDVSAVCSGFVYAMTIAAQFLHTGISARALVIGADTFSRITDWSSGDCVFFGDGAGAVVLERSEDPGAFFLSRITADSLGIDHFTVPSGDRYFRMNRSGVYGAARQLVGRMACEVLEEAEVEPTDVGHVIPHQASVKLLRDIAVDIEVGFDKFWTNMDRVGNTAGATIPIALYDAWNSGTLKKNDWIMFLAAGAGMTAGAALYRWH